MLEQDEFDAYNDSLDTDYVHCTPIPSVDHTRFVPCTPPKQQLTSRPPNEKIYPYTSSQSPSSPLSDEFATYDFSEFTPEDFAAIDAATLAALARNVSPVAVSSPQRPENPSLERHANKDTCSSALSENVFGGPAIDIEIERCTDATPSLKASVPSEEERAPSVEVHYLEGINSRYLPLSNEQQQGRSPLTQFRRYGVLSVTDLIGPSWCEVQFDYGLRQGRSKKLAERPSSFVTAEGKVITVDNSVAVVNDRVQTKGKEIHKALEREVHPDAVVVVATTKVERWGLRLVNMIAAVQSLIVQGRCREMPVFGVLHDELIVGIIDAIVKEMSHSIIPMHPVSPKRGRGSQSAQSSPRKKKAQKTHKNLSPAQSSITAYFSLSSLVQDAHDVAGVADAEPPVSPCVQDSPSPVPRSCLRVSDTKTRTLPGIPSDSDTLPARLQLMLYHRLLFNLLTASPRYFNDIWTHARVSSTEEFSAGFIEEAQLDNLGKPGAVRTLNDLVNIWYNVVEALHVDGIDRVLTVEYRSQRKTRRPSKSKSKSKGKGKATDVDVKDRSPTETGGTGDTDNKDVTSTSIGSPRISTPSSTDDSCSSDGAATSTSTPPSSNCGQISGLNDSQDSVDAIFQSTPGDASATSRAISDTNTNTPSDGEDTESEAAPNKWRIIGTKSFEYDGQFLESYLASVLQYWRGQRPPVGVDIELTRRCSSCEYRDGCEWRANKAEELAQLYHRNEEN